MNTIDPIRKAAILIDSLDLQTAESLLDQMPAEQARLVRAAVIELGDIDMDEQDAVIDEFFRIGPILPEDQPPGIKLSGSLIAEFSNTVEREASRPAFRSLREASGLSLAARLEREHPQMIAVVASHLPPEQGADLLAGLPSALQADVARRLVDLDETDPEIVLEIERGLEPWLREQHLLSRRRTVGMKTLESILNAADPVSSGTLLSNLSRHDRQLAKQLVASERQRISIAVLNRHVNKTV